MNGMLPRVKCLLVDDREDNLLVLEALLQQADDVDVLKASSGRDALDLLLTYDVALALLDVQMPEMDGFELAEIMRSAERTRHVPIIFVTAGARDQIRVFKGYELGAVDFLYKPLEPHIVRNKAAVFFQLYRQQQQLADDLRERSETLRLNEMFTAVLGHDLRNPLNAVLAAAQLLEHRSEDPAVRDTAAKMLSSAKRMSRLIEDMLDLARARLAGGIPLKREPADMGAVVQRVVQEHQPAYPDRPIEVVSEGDLTGDWDSERLTQVTSNLIGNALRHGSGGAVHVRVCGSMADAVSLSVGNAGTIDSELLPHIFDPFRGGERTGTRNEGLGLGLYIVHQIVQAHDGRIEVRSGPMSETVFSVTLPRRAAASLA